MADVQASLTKLANRVSSRTALRISAVALALELAIAATTFLPGAPLLPQDLPLLLFPGIFVVHFRSVVLLAASPRPSLRALWGRIPWQASVAFVALFFTCWFIAGGAISQIGGQPTERNGQFFLDDHGTLIPVSHGAYLHAIVLSQRIFTLIPAVFYALGVIANLAALSQEPLPS